MHRFLTMWLITFCLLAIGLGCLFGVAFLFAAAFTIAKLNPWLGIISIPAALAVVLALGGVVVRRPP
jgi:hypothetical protein